MLDERFRPAGKVRRLAAFLTDSLVLGLMGHAVGLAFFDRVAGSGPYGVLVGLVVMPLYLGLCASGVTAGQTLGKRLWALRVSRVGGGYLPIGRALVRSTILSAPYVLNGWSAKEVLSVPALGSFMAVLVFGVGGSSLYLFLLNRQTGQVLHDLVVGSVVHAATAPPLSAQPKIARVHGIAVTACLGLSLLIGAAAWLVHGRSEPSLHRRLWARLSEDPRFFTAAVNHDTSYRAGADPTTTLSIKVWLRHEPTDRGALVRELAAMALGHYKSDPADNLRVIIMRRYDLGIASWQQTWSEIRKPEEWRHAAAAPPN